MVKTLPSANCVERLQIGLPLPGAFLESRIAAAYVVLADLGCALEQFRTVEQCLHLTKELRMLADAADKLHADVMTRAEVLNV